MLNQLSGFPSDTFENRFSRIAKRLELGATLDEDELRLLFEAAFYACLCNIAFNGLGGCQGEIKPEREANRIRLEQDFMAVRERFLDCAGWRALAAFQRGQVVRIFLNVFVDEDKLAL